jgi:hypothetical protein
MLRSVRLATLLLVGCAQPSEVDADAGVLDAGQLPDSQTRLPRAPGGDGFCCPVGSSPNCNDFPYGGWVAEDEPTRCPRVADMAPNGRVEQDEHGCDVYRSNDSCLSRDAGP